MSISGTQDPTESHTYTGAGGRPRGGCVAHLVDCIRRGASRHPARIAYTFRETDGGEEQLCYEALETQARAMAASLQVWGASGERALLLLPPGLDYIAALYACLFAGVVAVPSYTPRKRHTVAGVATVIADARAKFAITTEQGADDLAALIDEFPALGQCHIITVDDLRRGCADTWQEPAIRESSIALLQYTSGSTSAPKGVVITHGNLLANLEMIRQRMALPQGAQHVFWLPPFHDMGLVGGIFQTVYCEASTTLLPPAAFLQRPQKWLQAISDVGAYVSGAPNFAYDLCARRMTPEQCESLDLQSWKVAFVGAESIRKETMERFAETFAPYGFRKASLYPCYGLAEATLFVSGDWWRAEGQVASVPRNGAVGSSSRLTSDTAGDRVEAVGCGKTPEGITVAIVNPETQHVCGECEEGEVWVSGPNVGQGYWENSDDTEAVFRAHVADDGACAYLRTGDLGFVKDGHLFITGRIKDLIIIHGQNHYPQDIEWSAQECCTAVRPGCCAAFAVSDAEGEHVVLVAEIDRNHVRKIQADMPGVEDTSDDSALRTIVTTLRRTIAEDHDLEVRNIVLVKTGTIPRTSSGKIQRRACRAQYMEGSLHIVGKG